MNKNSKPIINYVLISIIIISVILICMYIIKMYNIQKENSSNNSIMYQYINEIKSNEIDDYLVENERTFLYICEPKSAKCNEFEKSIETLLLNYNLRDNLLYLNASNINESKYLNNINIKKIPLIVVYNSNSIEEIIEISSIDEIINTLRKYGVNYLND